MSTAGDQAASVYRCADCGDGGKLMAWAPANAYGPVGADGELAQLDDVWDDGVHEDSIQCIEHPGAAVEKFADGRWCRWWSCPKCGGKGRIHVGESNRAPDGYPCREGKEIPGRYGPYRIHAGWRPLDEFATTGTGTGGTDDPA